MNDIINFENKINDLLLKNNWRLEIEFAKGIVIITILDRETSEYITSTGATSISIIPTLLENPTKYFKFK